MQFNYYIALLFISFLLSFVLSIAVYRRKEAVRGGNYFFLMMVAISIWSFGGAFEQAVTTAEAKTWWSVFTYLAIPVIPFAFFTFVLRFTQATGLQVKLTKYLFLAFPALAFIAALTNNYHKLLWPTVTISSGAAGLTADYGHGPFFDILVVVTYAIVAASIIHLVRAILVFSGVFRNQLILLLVAQILPISINFVYVFYGESIGFIDPTPVAFTVTGILISTAIFKYSFLDLIPVARNLLFDNLNEGVIVIDGEKRILDVNKTFMGHLNKSNLVGKKVNEILTGIPELFELCENTEISKTEFLYDSKCFNAISIDISDSDGVTQGRLISISDVTELKHNAEVLTQNRNELKELNSAKDKLLSIIAHDLKNPFFGIIGLSDIVIEDYSELDDDEKMKLLTEINQTAKDTFKTLENLLEWSRQQAGAISFAPESFDVNELIMATVEGYRSQAILKNLKLEIEVGPSHPVFADMNMIKTVLRNLITNAIKFTAPGGNIVVTSEKSGEMILVSVIDDGVGIAEEDIKKLFRIDESLKTTGTLGEKGTGLGLILCNDFVVQNGGSISVRRNSSRGTTFFFTLPPSQK
ncbi:histidine kinase N-terminal 7TM domain-containing protein [Ignavibacteriales bacterium]